MKRALGSTRKRSKSIRRSCRRKTSSRSTRPRAAATCGYCRTTRRDCKRQGVSWVGGRRFRRRGRSRPVRGSSSDVEHDSRVQPMRHAIAVLDLPVELEHPRQHAGFGPLEQDRFDRRAAVQTAIAAAAGTQPAPPAERAPAVAREAGAERETGSKRKAAFDRKAPTERKAAHKREAAATQETATALERAAQGQQAEAGETAEEVVRPGLARGAGERRRQDALADRGRPQLKEGVRTPRLHAGANR